MNRILIISFIALSIAQLTESITCGAKSDDNSNKEVQLKKKLLCNYDKNLRPGAFNEITMVNMRYSVKNFDYDDDARSLAVQSWMVMSWNDSRFKWDSSEFDDITSIHENIDSLWTPELYLYNANIASGMGTCHGVDCIIYSSSRVACVIPCEHVGHCNKGDYTNWPFDIQNCSFTFGSWMKTGEEINYNTNRVTVASARAKQNNLWNLLEATSVVNIGTYEVVPNETYPSVTFSFLIERHSAFHVGATIIPAFVLMINNLIVLWMTPGLIERFVLSAFNLFSHFICMDFLHWMIPQCGDSIPTVVIYFKDSQLIAAFLLFETIVVKLLTMSRNKPFKWVETITTFATKNIFGAFILTTPTQKTPEDARDLVENLEKITTDELIWITFCRLTDRTVFAILLFLYALMIGRLLPNGYKAINYTPVEVS